MKKDYQKKIGIAIHGGAGTILKSKMTAEKETTYRLAMESVLDAGMNLLENGESSIDAVELAVKMLEDNPLFNAGKGSVFTNEATHEMDASIMDGSNLKAGCVSMVSNVKNPVALSRAIMDYSEFVYLCGKGAEEFAEKMKLKFENDEYFFSEQRYRQFKDALNQDEIRLDHSDKDDSKKFGTVGAVALDSNGNLAAATSTGGMTNKKYGRVGDSAIIGAGTYANNSTCAVSCTGHGEYFIRAVAAYSVSALMEFGKLSLSKAADIVIFDKLKEMGGEGGLIAIDCEGNISMPFNSEGMYRASVSYNSRKFIDIYK